MHSRILFFAYLTSLLAVTDSHGLAQNVERPFRAVVSLHIPSKVPPPGQKWNWETVAEKKSFALIPCMPRDGVPGFTKLEVQKGSTLRWEVPAEACDGNLMTWFLVGDMQEEADVAEFLTAPEQWAWAQVSFRLRANDIDSELVILSKRGIPMWGSGRIVGPDGTPVRDMVFKVRAVSGIQNLPVGHSSSGSRRAKDCSVGMDPRSGRIWVQCIEEMGDDRFVLDIQPAAGSKHGLAAVHNIPLDPKQRLRIRVKKEAVLIGRIQGPERENKFTIHARLTSHAFPGSLCTEEVRSEFRLSGLEAGTYDLALTTASSDEVFYEQRGLVVTAGKTLQLHKPIDVRDLLLPVKIAVVDREGNPVTAQVQPFYIRKNGWSGRRYSTGADGIFHGFAVEPGGLFGIQSEGHAPRLIRGIKGDTRVVVYKPHELLVEIRGLPESPEARKNLSLRAEPLEGYVGHAYRMLRVLDWAPVAPRKGPKRPSGGIAGQYCSTKPGGDQPFLLRLTKPGKWKLCLVYHNIFDLKAIPLPGIVEISNRKHKLSLTVSAKVVDAARLDFLQQTERRKGRR